VFTVYLATFVHKEIRKEENPFQGLVHVSGQKTGYLSQ
jgi:hypothetical protein